MTGFGSGNKILSPISFAGQNCPSSQLGSLVGNKLLFSQTQPLKPTYIRTPPNKTQYVPILALRNPQTKRLHSKEPRIARKAKKSTYKIGNQAHPRHPAGIAACLQGESRRPPGRLGFSRFGRRVGMAPCWCHRARVSAHLVQPGHRTARLGPPISWPTCQGSQRAPAFQTRRRSSARGRTP